MLKQSIHAIVFAEENISLQIYLCNVESTEKNKARNQKTNTVCTRDNTLTYVVMGVTYSIKLKNTAK